jgi:tetratricopeptide (TPR) repeat protein
MTECTRRRLVAFVLMSSGLSVAAAVVVTYMTWPANAVANYFHDRQNQQANVRALLWRIGAETDPLEARFYQVWLAEEKGDLKGAIRGFKSLRDDARPGTPLHLKTSLRLGLAYGLNRQPDRELQTYLALMDRYPGPSRLSQATFYLRQGDRNQARRVLDKALAQDDEDGSLGSQRGFAQYLRAGLEPTPGKPASPSK